MTSSDLYTLFRLDVADSALPYLWADSEVFAYMNDAYRMFVRLTGGVADFTSAATQVPIVAGDPLGVLNPAILRVMSARRLSDGGEIKIINSTDLPVLRESGYGWPATVSLDATPGPVNYMMIGAQPDIARWIQVPTVNDTAQLIIYRKPLNYITALAQPFTDAAEDHHFHFLKWMRHLAYQKQDAETLNLTKSDENGTAFRVYCAEVTAELARREYKPRTIAYGGI